MVYGDWFTGDCEMNKSHDLCLLMKYREVKTRVSDENPVFPVCVTGWSGCFTDSSMRLNITTASLSCWRSWGGNVHTQSVKLMSGQLQHSSGQDASSLQCYDGTHSCEVAAVQCCKAPSVIEWLFVPD